MSLSIHWSGRLYKPIQSAAGILFEVLNLGTQFLEAMCILTEKEKTEG